MRTDGLRSGIRAALAALALALLTACTPIYIDHGYVPRDDELSEIVVGKSTQEDVGIALGRPSSIGVLTGSGWYYVGARFKQVGIRAPVELERQVVAISFDERGIVSNVERFALEDGEVVVISRRVTDSNIKGVGFLRQLLGNIGNIDASELLAND